MNISGGIKIFNKMLKQTGVRFVVILALFLFFMPNYSLAQSLDEKIKETEQNLNQTRSTAKSLSNEIASYDKEIREQQDLISSTIADINRTERNITETSARIVTAEKELAEFRIKLGEILRTTYEEGEISTLELIVQSRTFSDFVNRSEYFEAIQLGLKDTTDRIVGLRNELENKKKELEEDKRRTEQLKAEQVNQRYSLDQQKSGKNFLLQQTKGQESGYQTLLKQLYAERAAQASAGGQTMGGGGTGGYPYAGRCGMVDPWKFYTCQCTGYAAWKWNSIGNNWTNTRPGSGNAYQWVNLAGDQGYSVSSTPTVGSLAIWPIHSNDSPYYYDVYGHVAYVTGVSGNTVSVAEYNFINREAYGTRGNVQIYWRNNYNGNYYSLKFIN